MQTFTLSSLGSSVEALKISKVSGTRQFWGLNLTPHFTLSPCVFKGNDILGQAPSSNMV